LVWIVEGHQEDQWWHTASQIAMLANVNRDPKKRKKSYSPSDFHPLISKKLQAPAKDTEANDWAIEEMRHLVRKGKKK